MYIFLFYFEVTSCFVFFFDVHFEQHSSKYTFQKTFSEHIYFCICTIWVLVTIK